MISTSLLDAIYAIPINENSFAGLLAELERRFGCISSALVYVDPARPAADVMFNHGVFDADARRRYLDSYAEIDPCPGALAALPIGTAAATDRMFSPEVQASMRFVTEFYNPLGLYEALGAPIAHEDGRFGVLAVHRGRDRLSFLDDEIAAFGEIASHVARAVALRSRFFRLARAADMRGKMLDSVATGVMAVDASARLVEANAAARDLLGRADGLILTRSGRIRAIDRGADAAIGTALASAGETAPTIIVAPRAVDARPYALKVSPARGETRLGGGVWLIQVADEQASTGNVAEALVRALSLSPPSARLTAALLGGEDLRSYATRAGISLNTAKFHLKGAFRVTETRRQSELVRLAVSVLRDLSI